MPQHEKLWSAADVYARHKRRNVRKEFLLAGDRSLILTRLLNLMAPREAASLGSSCNQKLVDCSLEARMPNYRTDIQVLRGFAILSVIFYHANVSIFGAGYLGVDIFFVISGFLITGLIKNRIDRGTFSFGEFYFRRAKRLLPAAYVTFLVTALVAPFFLDAQELTDFLKQLVGAVTLTGNFVLWRQTGYFEGAAELKPLLHVWSLGIEEQYYLIMPALLVLFARRYWLPGAIAVVALSLLTCLVIGPIRPNATFYLLPTRAWELALGSVGALATPGIGIQKRISILFWPSVAALILLPTIPFGGSQPGLAALGVCMATLVIILRHHAIFETPRRWKVMTGLGNISYSLYLVHWPLISLFNNCWIGESTNFTSAALVAISIILAWLLYSYIEKPIHNLETTNRARTALAFGVSSGVLLLMPLAISHSFFHGIDYSSIRRPNFGFDEACESLTNFEPNPKCRNSDQPTIMVWGDSFAMHLVPGIAEMGAQVIQATRSNCGPMLEMAPITRANAKHASKSYNVSWARSCFDFNSSIISYLKKTPSVKTIVLSTALLQYFLPDEYDILEKSPDGISEWAPSPQLALDGLGRTVDAVRALKKRVVVIAPPPRAGNDIDIGRCLERRVRGLVILGPFRTCRIPLAEYKKNYAPIINYLNELPKYANVEVIRFDGALCESDFCKTQEGGTFIYRDSGHLSYEGSKLMAKKLDLVNLIMKLSR